MAGKLTFLDRAAVNPKTTSLMAIAAISYLLDNVAVPMLSGTDVDVNAVITPEFIRTMLEVITGVAILLAGMFTRDSDKSSQDNDVREPVSAKAIEARVTERVEEKLGVAPAGVPAQNV